MGIIIKPLVTEKMTAITDKTNNRFGFIVRPEANKLEIKKEVEALYNVTVVDVNTMKYAGKNKSRYTRAGIINGRTNAFKKAIVTLKEKRRRSAAAGTGYCTAGGRAADPHHAHARERGLHPGGTRSLRRE